MNLVKLKPEQIVASEQPESVAPVSVMIVAGEASGDEHAAAVVRCILAREPQARIFGMGGSAMRQAGVETVLDSQVVASVMGFTEVFGKWREIVSAFQQLVKLVQERKPAVVVLVDYPDFNLRLAKKIHAHCPNIIYFISPQLWAWRSGRVHFIKKYVRKVIPILPFEESFYHAHGVDAEFPGHPFLDRPEVMGNRSGFLRRFELDPLLPVLALLPGSRRAEVERLAPAMAEAFAEMKRRRPGIQAIVPVAPTLKVSWVEAQFGEGSGIKFVEGQAREILHFSDLGVIASGTATVEAALAGIPFVVVYRVSGLTFFLGRLLVRAIKFIAMPNLVMRKKVVNELLQEHVNAGEICEELERILGDASYKAQMLKALQEVKRRLRLADQKPGGAGAAERVAEIILDSRQAPGVSPN